MIKSSMKRSVNQDIVVVTDYHSKNVEYRWYDCLTGEERRFNRATSFESMDRVLAEASAVASARGGQAVWIMESTTGWARVKKLIGGRARFVLANVLRVARTPKAYRRKTDALDTAGLLREQLRGDLPEADQPGDRLRSDRRVVALREDLVRRRTCLRNQVTAYFAHETWEERGFYTESGMVRLKGLIAALPDDDRFVLEMKVDELEVLDERIARAEAKVEELCRRSPEAQRVDEIKGIGPIAAASIVARIGSIKRFVTAEQLIGYAGLAPGVRQSDAKKIHLSIGGGGTDKHLRHYLIEATMWARQIPRYRDTCERVEAKRGKKIARIVVARMVLRSIHKMLTDGVPFQPAA
jgi:transposase